MDKRLSECGAEQRRLSAGRKIAEANLSVERRPRVMAIETNDLLRCRQHWRSEFAMPFVTGDTATRHERAIEMRIDRVDRKGTEIEQ